MRDDILRSCIVGYRRDGAKEKFKKDDDGGLSKEVFRNYPPDLITPLRMELNRISNLSAKDVMGL
jgi:hypothetical protein